MHTVKGNARTFGISFAVDALHQAEQFYDQVRKNPELFDQNKMQRDLQLCQQALRRYQEVFRQKLGGLNSTSATGEERAVSAFTTRLQDALANKKEFDSATKISWFDQLTQSMLYAPLDEVLATEIGSLPEIASKLDKAPPKIDITGKDILIHKDHHGLLRDIFTHCLRNAIGHGLETIEKRKAARKNPHGTIKFTISLDQEKLHIRLTDDGQGLNLPVLRKKGLEKGVLEKDASDEEIAKLIFASGVSTAEKVDDISGRGVGMDAVRSFLRDREGDIKLSYTHPRNEQTGMRSFEFDITLPARVAKKAVP